MGWKEEYNVFRSNAETVESVGNDNQRDDMINFGWKQEQTYISRERVF
jgi:hypothetical protein